jgi:hypothetical protein
MFYQLGALQTWEMTCELFEYSDEVFNTGIPDIDRIQLNYSTNMLDYVIMDETGAPILDEQGNFIEMEQYNLETIEGTGANPTMSNESSGFIDWSVQDPFSEGQI